jgi:LuxR family transcriptional regulator, maltose regulon positive regulatory protein
MAGSRQSEPGPGAALEQDQIVETKVTIPRLRPDSLRRSRLLEALDDVAARELTLVCTPAGFGKTTLLADWAQGADLPVAWLSLDSQDNDPTRFWRHVGAAIDRAAAPVGERVLTMVDPRAGSSSEGAAAAVINELAALTEDLALVLDDYHVVESASIHDGLSFLLSHLPPRLHLAIASRSDPPLPVARLRARGQLTELRAAELRFTAQESAALLREVWGLDLSPEAVAALEGRTEGWAVGLQLAALSLRERPDPGAFVDAFTGTHRYVLDYLSEEVLERQPERVRAFLLKTSILNRLSGPLCDAVTGGSDGQDMLEDLERANVFLVPLDEERRWYRYHDLFADLLRARVRRTHPGDLTELHRRAAIWCERHGLIDEAIRHAISSEERDWAARLVEEHLGETLRHGEGVILDRWLSMLPEDVVRFRPKLCLAQGWMQLHIGHLDSAERLVKHAEQAFEHGEASGELELPSAGGMVAEVPAAIALLRADIAAARGDTEGSAGSARSALAQMGQEEFGPRFLARFQLACADWMAGRLEKAEPALTRLLAEGRATPDPYPLVSSCYALGQVQAGRGKLGAALRTNREGLRYATKGSRLSPFHAGEAHIGMAQVLYQRDELEDALQHATAGIELCRHTVEFVLPAVGLVALAWIRNAMGEADAAREATDEACRIRPGQGFVTLWNPAQAERARLLLAQGRVKEAERWAEEQGLNDHDELPYHRERDYLVLVRLLLARAEPARALRLLERLATLAESQDRNESVIHIGALRSVALQAAGDHRGALASLAQALSLARPEGYVRVFADEGPPMAALLRGLVTAGRGGRLPGLSGAARDHLNRIVRAFGAPARHGGGTAPAVATLVVPLTDRELEVLRLVGAGKRNREIARELVVTLETVKKHISHIFEKIGADNRTEAVARAREVGLIP